MILRAPFFLRSPYRGLSTAASSRPVMRRSPVKYTWPDRRRPIERPSIIPALLWIAVVIVASYIGWHL